MHMCRIATLGEIDLLMCILGQRSGYPPSIIYVIFSRNYALQMQSLRAWTSGRVDAGFHFWHAFDTNATCRRLFCYCCTRLIGRKDWFLVMARCFASIYNRGPCYLLRYGTFRLSSSPFLLMPEMRKAQMVLGLHPRLWSLVCISWTLHSFHNSIWIVSNKMIEQDLVLRPICTLEQTRPETT